jgi:predicted transcriptional regulator
MNSRGAYKAEAKELAISYRKRGFSYGEIAKICTVSPSTVHTWLAHEAFSQAVTVTNKKRAAKDNKARIGLVNKARRSERAVQYKSIIKLAETEYKHYRTSPLFMAGLMVYVSEGDTEHAGLIRMANSQPELHRIFLRFAREFLGVEKKQIHFWLLLFPSHNEVACMKHWIKAAGLSAGQFYKNQVVKGRSQTLTLHFGVGNTIIGSTLLKKKLIRWIELAKKELVT